MSIVAFVGLVLIITIVWGEMGVWLGRHGGVDRWRMWLLCVVAGAFYGAAIPVCIQPFDLRFVVALGATGAVGGAVMGLFLKIPPSARRRTLHRNAQQQGTSESGGRREHHP